MDKKLAIVIGIIIMFVIAIIGISVTHLFSLPEANTIKIGFVGPLSGNSSLWGQGSLDMINLAIDEINSNGGINGSKIELIIEDSKGSAESAVGAANKLIYSDNVRFVLGGIGSTDISATAPIFEANKVFGLGGVSSATGILDKTTYAFRTSPENKLQAELIANLAINKYNLKNIAILTEQSVYAKSISDDFRKQYLALGGKFLVDIEFNEDVENLRTELIKIKDSNAEAIFISTKSLPKSANIMRQIKELGISLKLIGGTIFVSKTVYTDSNGSLPNDAFTVGPFVDINAPKMSELNSKFKLRYGHDIPYNLFFVGAAYDGVYMLKEALLKCGENPECVRDYFNKINYKGITANFTFDAHGNPTISNWKELHIINGKEIFSDIS
jgi:branched-chain amino acid transport system substrate-binding protein